MTLQAVLKEALALAPDDRAKLADELWRSVWPQDRDAALTPTQADDLRKRIDEDAQGKSDPQDWKTARASLGPKK